MASAPEPSAHPRTPTGTALLEPASTYERGARVLVEEPGISPWIGTVGATKRGSRCWYVEVRRDDDGLTYVVPERYVELLTRPHRAEPKAEDGGPLTPLDEWAETEVTGR